MTTRKITTPNTPGEILLRGPTIIKGYLNNPTANALTFTADGWYRTGDIAYVDKETGNVFIIDRKKELIKSRGFQVAPPEVEAVLLGHPSIIDAAVIGVRARVAREYDDSPAEDEKKMEYIVDGDEHPRAYVILAPGAKVSKKEVTDWVQKRLVKYKWLSGGVEIVDMIPKNASGKILKKVLRATAEGEVGLASEDVVARSAKL